MRKILLISIALLTAVAIKAQEVVRESYHYATHQSEQLYLDKYVVEDECQSPRPALIFAFGGGFVRGQRDNDYYVSFFERMARAGIVVVSIDYRLGLRSIPEGVGLVDMIGLLDNAVTIAVEDLYAATCYVVDNSQQWGVDTSKIMISGSSAGAITALQAEWLRCNGAEIAEVLPSDFRYAAVISCAGAIFSTKGKPKFRCEPAPMMLFHGTSDSNVPYNKASVMGVGFFGSKYVAGELKRLDAPYYFYSAQYVDHSLAATPLHDQCDLILQFIDEYVVRGVRAQIEAEAIECSATKRDTHFSVKEYLSTNYSRE